MNAEQLKNSILQRAIEGKLVEQREEEGTAAELLREIKAEKARLVKEGKLKKEKPLPEIKAEEIPFEIPESWEWVRLCDLGWFSSGKTPAMHEPRNWTNGTVPWITSKDMKTKYLVDSQMKITELAKRNMTTYPVGTLLFVVRSGILKRMLPICILTMESTINQDIKAYTLFNNKMSSYLYYMLKGLESHILLNYTKRVTTVDSLKFDEFSREMPVPLPPLAEQKRIVAKIEELLPHVEQYGKAHDELTALNEKFPDAMKKSVLQYAMEGKLVEQREEEGTAKELLAAIKSEKAKLVKEGKLKKEKPLPEIKAEEIPFEIPESWEWVRLGDVCVSIADGDHQPPPQTQSGIPFLVISNVSSGNLSFDNTRFVPLEYYNALQYGRIPAKGDILFTVTGSYGIPVLIDTERAFCFQRHISLLKLHKLNGLFFSYWLSSYSIKSQCDLLVTGTAQKTLSLGSLKSLLFPLPPLAEQRRIVAKIEKMLACCGALGNKTTA